MLERLRSESRNKIRSRMQKKNERVTSRLFLPGDLKSYSRAWRSNARKLNCPRLPMPGLGERWEHFRALTLSTPVHLGHKGDRNSRQHWAIILFYPSELLLFCISQELNPFQEGNG